MEGVSGDPPAAAVSRRPGTTAAKAMVSRRRFLRQLGGKLLVLLPITTTPTNDARIQGSTTLAYCGALHKMTLIRV